MGSAQAIRLRLRSLQGGLTFLLLLPILLLLNNHVLEAFLLPQTLMGKKLQWVMPTNYNSAWWGWPLTVLICTALIALGARTDYPCTCAQLFCM